MARGSFGRRRGKSTNLTALIASLLREQRQAEDRAIFDAYKNGGKYKGKVVTDSMILDHMKSRRDGFTKDDPLYDEWNNRLIQTRFSIGEQKVGLAFKQGRVGAGAVAAYYRKQLQSIPKDSAFYRDVAGRAAEWAKAAGAAARGRARGSASAGKRAALNKQLEAQQNYLALEAALTAYARREGIISGSQELSEADATDLQDMFNRGIYAGKDRITFEDFRSAAKDHYVALGGEIQTRLQLGNQTIEARNKRSRFLNETLVRLNAVDDRAKYEMAREVLIDATRAANGDPYAIRAAYDAYAKALQGIHEVASKPGNENANDPEFMGGLVNEFKVITTGENTGATVADVYGIDDDLQQDGGIPADIALLTDHLDRLDKGTAYYGQTEPGGALGVVDWPAGASSNPLGLDDSLQPSISVVNGERRVVYLKGESVAASYFYDNRTGQSVDPATIIDPKTGQFLDAPAMRALLASGDLQIERGNSVGYVFTNPINGDVKYGVRDPATGNMFFTDENPWSSDPVTAEGGLTVFTGTTTRKNGDVVADLSRVYSKPVNIDTADPLLSDSTVAPKDLLALSESGAVTGLSEDELVRYQAKLKNAEQKRLTALSNRDVGLTDIAGVGRDDVTTGGGGDLRVDVLNSVASITPTVQSLFGSPSQKEADFRPPPAPTPPSLSPTATPGITPPPDAFDPWNFTPTSLDPPKDPTGPGGSTGAGSWGAVEKYKKKIQDNKDAATPDPNTRIGTQPI